MKEKAAESQIVGSFASLRIMGTLGILELAAERGLLDLPSCSGPPEADDILCRAKPVAELLERDADRKRLRR